MTIVCSSGPADRLVGGPVSSLEVIPASQVRDAPLYTLGCPFCFDEQIAGIDSLGQWWLLDPMPRHLGSFGGVLLNGSRIVARLNLGDFGFVAHQPVCTPRLRSGQRDAHDSGFDLDELISVPFRRWW